MKIKVGISNRHIHLCQEDADILFGKDYVFNKRNDLTQTGEFACLEQVKVSTDKYEFPYVRVLGPIRKYTQVEVSLDDAKLLEIDPPIRDSGDLDNSESVWIEGPKGKIYKENCCIRAVKHIHCSERDNIGYKNNDVVTVMFNGHKIEGVHIKMKDSYVLEMHIDKNDAAEYGLTNEDFVELD